MTRSLIIQLFWGSIIGLVAGLVLVGVTAASAISNDIFVMSGPDVTGIRSGVLSWTLLGLMASAVFVLLLAAAAHFVAWIGAVLNTARLPDKTWLVVLLVFGLLGFVFVATIAYVIAGPDGLKVTEEASAPPQAGSGSGTDASLDYELARAHNPTRARGIGARLRRTASLGSTAAAAVAQARCEGFCCLVIPREWCCW